MAGEEAPTAAVLLRSVSRLKKRPDYDREKPQERVAKLAAGGAAVIKAGAATEVENEREESPR